MIGRLILAAGAVLGALLGFEGVVRLLMPAASLAPPSTLLLDEDRANHALWAQRHVNGALEATYGFDMPDARLGWRLRPDVQLRVVRPGAYAVNVTTDAAGRRTVPDGTRRHNRPVVAIFGDSQTFGEGVGDGESYPARLQKLLPTARVLNYGIHGYGTDQQLLYLQERLAHERFDVVALGFAWFHASRNVRAFGFFAKPRFELRDHSLVLSNVPIPGPDQVGSIQPSLVVRLLARSALARWGWQRIRNARERTHYEANSEALRLTMRLLEEFTRSATDAGASVLIMSIDESLPEREHELAREVRNLGASFVNLGPLLREWSDRRIEYRLPLDGHWNPWAHEHVALQLRDAICSTYKAASLGCIADRELIHSAHVR